MFVFIILSFFQLAFSQPSDKPNFIFVFADDLGYGDLSSYGHPYCITPNIDRLANEGTSFHQFHMTGNVCPTSRAGLMTSRNPSWFPNYPAQYGFLGTKTVTEYLHDGGYNVGHIGKWNIGPTPADDEENFLEYGIDYLRITGSTRNDPRGREGLRFDKTLEFLDQQRPDKPFYLNLWIYAPHSPIDPPDDLIKPFQELVVDRNAFDSYMQNKFDDMDRFGGNINLSMQKYCGELYGLDLQMGRLLDKLDELRIANNTIVVFSSDNGPEDVGGASEVFQAGYAGGLRGGKHSWYEGGIRVPFIVRWPGNVPAGKINKDSIMFGLDWLPTICSIAGIAIRKITIDGEDLSDVWLGSNRSRKFPILYRNLQEQNEVTVRANEWKFLDWKKELYNLTSDPEERNNIYDDYPEVVQAIKDTIELWETTLPNVNARLPDEPYPFDPNEPAITIPQPYIPSNPSPNSCFSGSNTVNVLGKGLIPISELMIGDYVMTDENNRSFSHVYSFGHKDDDNEAVFIQIFVNGREKPLEISGAHLLYKNNELIRAQDVRVGDLLPGQRQVVKINRVQSRGMYAPVTVSGTIVVSGVAASSYVALLDIHPSLMTFTTHVLLSPLRVVCSVHFHYCEQETYSNGLSDTYLEFIKLIGFLSGFNRIVQLFVAIIVTMFMAWFFAFEMIFMSPSLFVGSIKCLFCLSFVVAMIFKTFCKRKSQTKYKKN